MMAFIRVIDNQYECTLIGIIMFALKGATFTGIIKHNLYLNAA